MAMASLKIGAQEVDFCTLGMFIIGKLLLRVLLLPDFYSTLSHFHRGPVVRISPDINGFFLFQSQSNQTTRQYLILINFTASFNLKVASNAKGGVDDRMT